LLLADILDDSYGEMIPLKKAIGPSKGQGSTWGKNIAIDESTRTK
jgi:hypothetical protein